MKSDEVRRNWRDVLQYAQQGGTVIVEHYNRPVAQIGPIKESAMIAVGTRVTVPEYSVPEDWAHEGQVVELGDETAVVALDDGHRQELPRTEITTA